MNEVRNGDKKGNGQTKEGTRLTLEKNSDDELPKYTMIMITYNMK
jgi:hypothetical protein